MQTDSIFSFYSRKSSFVENIPPANSSYFDTVSLHIAEVVFLYIFFLAKWLLFQIQLIYIQLQNLIEQQTPEDRSEIFYIGIIIIAI